MTYFLRSGTRFDVTSKDKLNLTDPLPVGTYTVKLDERQGVFYLESVRDFELPSKIYGDTPRVGGRILHTFRTRPKGTGVLLSGEKGAGGT